MLGVELGMDFWWGSYGLLGLILGFFGVLVVLGCCVGVGMVVFATWGLHGWLQICFWGVGTVFGFEAKFGVFLCDFGIR